MTGPDRHPYRITSTKCHINTVVSRDDGHIVARNLVKRNKHTKKICAPSWLYLQEASLCLLIFNTPPPSLLLYALHIKVAVNLFSVEVLSLTFAGYLCCRFPTMEEQLDGCW